MAVPKKRTSRTKKNKRKANCCQVIRNFVILCTILGMFVDSNDRNIPKTMPINSSTVQSIVRLNGGGMKIPKNVGQQSIPPVGKISKDLNYKSVDSNLKTNKSTKQFGNKVAYFPGGNPGGSGSGEDDFCDEDWQKKASCPDPDEIITSPDFWNSYLGSLEKPEVSPNPEYNVESDEDDKQSTSPTITVNEEKPAPTPTAKLDKENLAKYKSSTTQIKPITFSSKEGIDLTIKNDELDKIVYAHSPDIGLSNEKDAITCPVQTDPTKYQRTNCREVTDESKKEAIERILKLTTSDDPNLITLKFPMPSYPAQEALAYIDQNTRKCLFFHADSGKLWSAKTLDEGEMSALLENPKFKNLE